MIRVLEIEVNNAKGGIESFIYNYVSHNTNHEIKLDIVTTCKNLNMESWLVDKKCQVIHVNRVNYILKIMRAIKKNKYHYIHIHKNSLINPIPLIACKLCGFENVILHSHNSQPSMGKAFSFLHYINRKIFSNTKYKFACSDLAANWMFGDQKGIFNIYNGVDFKEFNFNFQKRISLRNKLGIENRKVIGHVGRFTEVKNQKYLINLISELLKNDSSFCLLLIGDGALKDKCYEYAKLLGVDKNVFFLGERNNVCDFMQVMDIFVMPSLFEGLPIVGVEAQVTGLPCIFSNNITPEVKISDYAYFLDLNNKQQWIDSICNAINSKYDRNNSIKKVDNRFDIVNTVNQLNCFYSTINS